MDVITISSDSETSVDENMTIKMSTSPICPVIENDNFVDWNDEDVRPAINYSIESPGNKSFQPADPAEEIEDFITPVKPSETNLVLNRMTDNNIPSTQCADKVSKKTKTSLNLETYERNNFAKSPSKSPAKQRQKLSQEDKEILTQLKEQKKLEKEKLKEEKRIEQLKQKALKAAFFENQRKLKPEENIKFLKVHIDNNIINAVFGGNIISVLQQNNIQYVVEPQIEKFTIIWSKERVEKVINDYGELTDNVQKKDESLLLYVLDWKTAVELIHKNELLTHIETVKSSFIDKKLTVIIYGLGKYFSYQKNKKNQAMRAEVNDKKKTKVRPEDREYEDAPKITGDQLEFALMDLQLIGKHNYRLLEVPEEVSALIYNFTKSLSQIEYKLDKQKRTNYDLGWIATDSSSHSVKVDKNGNGLLQLWQRQICQFNAVGLETSQAIVSHFNSPLALMNGYEKCQDSKEAELLLQNIQIRRNAGIVSTSRRVGPQLSKKMYKFFMSDDPDEEL